MGLRVLISIVIVLVALGGGGGLAYLLIEYGPETPRRDVANPPLVVRGTKLVARTVQEELIGYGTARADRMARVSAQVGGRVERLADALAEGQRVTAGVVLVELDARDYEQQLERAQNQVTAIEAELANLAVTERKLRSLVDIAGEELEVARREYERVLDLAERDMTGQRELDAALVLVQQRRRVLTDLREQLAALPNQRAQLEATRAQLRAEVTLAELNLERTEIRAPFDGVIESVAVEAGEVVAAGTPLFAILDPRLIEVPIELPISAYNRVREGTPVTLRLETDRSQTWRGEVARISPSGSAALRSFPLYVMIDNREQDEPLVPGQFVRAAVAGKTYRNALTVPRGSLKDETVFVFEDGIAQQRAVDVRRRLREDAVIAGVEPGRIVITSNLDTLYDGMTIELDQQTAALLEQPPSEPVPPSQTAAGDAAPQS